jgi:hypothetical protein
MDVQEDAQNRSEITHGPAKYRTQQCQAAERYEVPLSSLVRACFSADTIRAVQNGATTLAESFLFLVAAGLVIGETWRSNRKEGKRRDDVRDRLEGLEENVKAMRDLLEGGGAWKESIDEVRERYVIILTSPAACI